MFNQDISTFTTDSFLQTSDNLEPPNTEYVNMLSKELLRGPQPNGTVPPLTESCSRGSRQVLDYNSLIPSRLFYSNSSRLKDALHKMISNSVTEECSLMSLTARFCKVLNVSITLLSLVNNRVLYDHIILHFQHKCYQLIKLNQLVHFS